MGACVPYIILIAFLVSYQCLAVYQGGYDYDYDMHPHYSSKIKTRAIPQENKENYAEFWMKNAQMAVNERLKLRPNQNIAKNVILFLGDGMSIPTISAARAYLGGEESNLEFDKFPYTALSKTYCVDHQVADSACSATAYLGGVKGNLGTIGVNGFVARDDCKAMTNRSNHVNSIAYFSQLNQKSTGLVTTARVTHASPAGVYAHTAERDWECDTNILEAGEDPNRCTDIARQLVYGDTGMNLNVVLGGGRAEFLPKSEGGHRSDNVDLIADWLSQKKFANKNAEYVATRDDLFSIKNKTDYLLGLFDTSHMPYNLERDPNLEPSLAEMTKSAIKLLNKNPNGYFLFVEGARIDMGHHDAKARKALNETVEFSNAVKAALDVVDLDETLVVVTADHAHTMSYSGYADRGQDILGMGGEGADNLPYLILNYANGPGYKTPDEGKRHDLTFDPISDIEYKYPGIFPLTSETHGGDDVGIFAIGPWAHLFTGVMEENLIPHLMSYAACVGEGLTACQQEKEY